jgi:hypothetical protein
VRPQSTPQILDGGQLVGELGDAAGASRQSRTGFNAPGGSYPYKVICDPQHGLVRPDSHRRLQVAVKLNAGEPINELAGRHANAPLCIGQSVLDCAAFVTVRGAVPQPDELASSKLTELREDTNDAVTRSEIARAESGDPRIGRKCDVRERGRGVWAWKRLLERSE